MRQTDVENRMIVLINTSNAGVERQISTPILAMGFWGVSEKRFFVRCDVSEIKNPVHLRVERVCI